MSGWTTPIRVAPSVANVRAAAANLRRLYNQTNITPQNAREMRNLLRYITASRHLNRNLARLTMNVRMALNHHNMTPQRINFNNSSSNNNEVTSELPINTKNMNLPENRPVDPISLNNFNRGNIAIKITQNGHSIFLTQNSFNTLFGKKWRSIPPTSNARISKKRHPTTRKFVLRKHVTRVKFI